jgi:uronate dehydrogenase
MKRILLTGAAGKLGRVLTRRLLDFGYWLRLTDIQPGPSGLDGTEFVRVDLADGEAVMAMCEGVDAVVHLGAISKEDRFERILEANIRGTYHVFEGAHRHGNSRVVFASSAHVVGFHARGERLTEDCPYRPDTFYGLSNAYGELLARYYWDKHGLESACLRVGSAVSRPRNERHLSTWLSYGDLAKMVRRCLEVKKLGAGVFWGVSGNQQGWWSDRAAEVLGFQPSDDAETYRDEVQRESHRNDPIARQYQGGSMCSDGFTRESSPQVPGSPRRIR